MIVECSQCKKRYRIEEDKIPASGAKIKCKSCGTLIIVPPPGRPAPPPPRADAAAPPPGAPALPIPPGLKVLLALADEPLRAELQPQLAARKLEIREVRDGIEALLELDRNPTDLALIGIELPRMFGFEISQVIRRDPRQEALKIILIGAERGPKKYQRPAESLSGADVFLERDEASKELIPAIIKLWEKKSGVTPRPAEVPRPPATPPPPKAAPAPAPPPPPPLVETPAPPPPPPIAAPAPPKVPTPPPPPPPPPPLAAPPVAAPAPPKPAPAPPAAKPPEAPAAAGSPEEEKAKRLARIIVSDIALYNADSIKEGLEKGNFYELLKRDIEESYKLFKERVPAPVREAHDYLKDALEQLVANKKKELGIP